MLACFLMTGCAQTISTDAAKDTQSAVKEATKESVKIKGPVYKGKVVGKSNKAKQISIQVGKGDKAETIMVGFDDNTKGVEHAAKGHGAIIACEIRDGKPFATVIKPKLAKMPPGVTILTPEDVKALIESDTKFMLIDSRPGGRYAASHLPGAVSIPVCEMQELLQNLPKDRDKLLVFYCGGPT